MENAKNIKYTKNTKNNQKWNETDMNLILKNLNMIKVTYYINIKNTVFQSIIN